MNIDDIKTIGVLGGGVMGQGISQSAILAGYKVICRDLTDELAAKAKDNILNGRFGLAGGLQRGKLTQEQVDRATALLKVTSKVEDLKDVDILIEAIGGAPGVMEDKGMKLKVFGEMDKIVKKEAMFASNTSYFTIADLAAVTTRKDRFLGMHFFSPASVMKGCEVIWTAAVRPEVVDLVMELGRRLGKSPVKVKDVPGDTGFVGNRVYRALRQEANKIVQEGIATAEDVDTVMVTGFNWPVGPLSMGRGARGGWKK
jgi:3-hydroxybutyryl-CoA dehydrogenase